MLSVDGLHSVSVICQSSFEVATTIIPKYMILHIQAKIKAYKTDYHVHFYCKVTLLVNGVYASYILLLS